MSVKWEQNFTVSGIVESKLERAADALGEGMSDHAAKIKTNVAGGKTFDGKSLGRYSASYAKKRAASGRRTSPVTLNWTGSMMRSLSYEGKKTGNRFVAEIFFRPVSSIGPDGQAASAPEKARNIMRKRKFFGMSKKQFSDIIKNMKNAMKGN